MHIEFIGDSNQSKDIKVRSKDVFKLETGSTKLRAGVGGRSVVLDAASEAVKVDNPLVNINFHELAKKIAHLEKGKKQVGIGQISEILKITLDLLSEEWVKNPHGVDKLFTSRHKKLKRKGLVD